MLKTCRLGGDWGTGEEGIGVQVRRDWGTGEEGLGYR